MIRAISNRVRKSRRYVRLGMNLAAGSGFIAACYQFPGISGIQNTSLNEYSLFRKWVDDLAYSMNTKLKVIGEPIENNGLFVSNHISWLDTIVLNNITPLSFVARHDLAGWPLLGTFTQRMECVYIDRSNKFQAYRSIPAVEEKLLSGKSVHIFPETTTSNGMGLLPFYSMFFEAAVRTGAMVQPVCINYLDGDGVPIQDPAFIGEDSFIDTLDRILKVDKVFARVEYLEPLDATKLDRKALSRRSFRAISSAHKKTCK